MAHTLEPAPGRVLVELGGNYKHIDAPAKSYEGKSNGTIYSARAFTDSQDWMAKLISEMKPGESTRLFWQSGREREKIDRDGKQYALVLIEDIDGWERINGK